MTTIAWDAASGVMAADTQCTAGNRKFRTSKVKRLKCGGLIGGSGSVAHMLKVQRWAEGGFNPDALPDFGDDGGDFEALIVKGDGSVFLLDEEMELMPFTDAFIAVGSGGPYAVAAMACGKSPADAVEIAGRFDAATSGPVETFRLERPKGKKHKGK